LVERSQVKLQKDFENWWQEQCEIIEQKNQRQRDYEDSRKISTADSVASSIPSVANSMLSNNSRANSGNEKPRLLPHLDSDK
jgi:hypothetical protein